MRRYYSRASYVAILILVSNLFAGASEITVPEEPTYVSLYNQGMLGEAMKELDAACAGKAKDDGCKIWKCLLELEKAAIMKEQGEGGYDKIAFDNYLILKPILLRNGDNPDYWLAAAKSFALNKSPGRSKKALEKALHYRKDFPEARYLRIELGEESDPATSYDEFLSLAERKGTPPFLSAKAYVRLAGIDYRKFQRNLNANTLDSAETLREKNTALKRNVATLLEKAIAAGPDSAYGKIAEERIRNLGAN